MEKKLDLILHKLETLDEVKEIVLALRDRQEATDAKLENMSMDLHKMHGQVTALKDNDVHIKNQLSDIKDELEFASHKTYRNEIDIFKLKRDHSGGFDYQEE